MMDVLKVVRKTIEEQKLINRGERVLIGLSGGADSAALFHILRALQGEYGIEIACAHVNHGLRETADRDMEFCRALCEEYGVEFHCLTADIKNGAKNAGMSEELYARKVRYEYFSSLGFDKIATAHNKNDAAETLLFNFMRGAAVKGLSGIPYRRGNVIRPILDIKKKEIIDFCEKNGYNFVVDETNFEAVYTRNKIRLNLIPEIEKNFNPNFVEVVTKNARLFKEDSDFLESLSEKAAEDEITSERLAALPQPIKRRVLQLHWKRASKSSENLPSDYIDALIELADRNITGKSVSLPHGFEAAICYGRLMIRRKSEKKEYEYKIYPGIILNIPEAGKNVIIAETDRKADFYLADGIGLTVRNRRRGDIFYPTGMTGRKKLSDYFTDRKLPSHLRDDVPILLKNGEIVSVGGMRSDRRFSGEGKGYRFIVKD